MGKGHSFSDVDVTDIQMRVIFENPNGGIADFEITCILCDDHGSEFFLECVFCENGEISFREILVVNHLAEIDG